MRFQGNTVEVKNPAPPLGSRPNQRNHFALNRDPRIGGFMLQTPRTPEFNIEEKPWGMKAWPRRPGRKQKYNFELGGAKGAGARALR